MQNEEGIPKLAVLSTMEHHLKYDAMRSSRLSGRFADAADRGCPQKGERHLL